MLLAWVRDGYERAEVSLVGDGPASRRASSRPRVVLARIRIVGTITDCIPWTGSQAWLPAASASAVVTGSVTFVANVVTSGVFRPRYVSGTQANFRDIQLTVVKLGDIP